MNMGFLHDYNLYNINMSSKEIVLSCAECFTETPRIYNIHLIDVHYFFGSELKEGNIILDIEVHELAKIPQKEFDQIFTRETDGVKVRIDEYSGKYIFYLCSSYGCDLKAIVGKIRLTALVDGKEEICDELL